MIRAVIALLKQKRGKVLKKSDQGPLSRKSRNFSGDNIVLFVSSKRRRLEARNFAFILIFIPRTTNEKTSFTE